MKKQRQCFYILETEYYPPHGYIPALVTENEAGYQLMSGKDEHTAPWYWGPSLELARETANKLNMERWGITEEEALKIVSSSMASGRPLRIGTVE